MSVATPPPYGNVNTPQPTITQLKQTAAELVTGFALGIMPQDTFQSLADVGRQALWKYETSSGHPTLAPTGKERTAGTDDVPDEKWKSYLGGIVNSLPEDVQDKLAAMNRLSPEERNPVAFEHYHDWKSLDNLIKYAAKSEYFATYALGLMQKESSRNEAVLNSQLPGIVSNSMAAEAEKLAESVKVELKKHLNNPEYDACSYLVSQYMSLIDQLAKAKKAE